MGEPIELELITSAARVGSTPDCSASRSPSLSFTFPVGTLVTGTSELALHTHARFLSWASVGLYALLAGAWLTAATGTARGSPAFRSA